ncbi:sulfurtransferase TusA family protein [Vibrio rumoiensis]|uniref:Sulfurtransferase TusA family protein n=1 Tax=Vibrio rumoiensis TaxID=76258 RepID=A0ABW7IT01_9VIBR|nr:sulfurtransferase TusA family protein [Vibrio rumoiensis]
MKVECLDLRSYRCPMALLLAKRRGAELLNHQSLTILSNDHASINDMIRYFNQNPYSIKVQYHDDECTLLVTKKE